MRKLLFIVEVGLLIMVRGRFCGFKVAIQPTRINEFIRQASTFRVFQYRNRVRCVRVLFRSLSIHAFQSNSSAALRRMARNSLLCHFVMSFNRNYRCKVNRGIKVTLYRQHPDRSAYVVKFRFDFDIPLLTRCVNF